MGVKEVPTLGWTRGDVAATITLVTKQQREAIAARVREGMAREGLTNASLARKADLAEKTISRLINAKLEPRYDTLERVAKVLKISERELRGAQRAPLGLDLVPEPEEAAGPPDTAMLLAKLEAIEDRLRLMQAEAEARAGEVREQIAQALEPNRETRKRRPA